MELIEQLRAMGFDVEPFVIRVNKRLEIYLPSGKWRDTRSGERGRIHLDSIPQFIKKRLERQARP